MKTKTIPDYPRGITFEQVWAALMEDRERQKETDRQMKKTFQEIRESHKETEQIVKENSRQIEEYNKRFGDWTNRFGEVVECMVAPNLQERFNELGLNFPGSSSNSVISDRINNIFLEIDVKLENGDKVMLVEMKTNLTAEDVKEHTKRLEKMRVYADLHGDKHKFLGAVAGVVIKQNVKDYAFAQGLYIVEPSGKTFNITSPEGIYSPREW